MVNGNSRFVLTCQANNVVCSLVSHSAVELPFTTFKCLFVLGLNRDS